ARRDAGAAVGAADASGGVALTYAAAAGSTDAVDLLQKRGARPTPGDLLLAAGGCSAPTIRVLLASGLKPDAAPGSAPPLLAAAGENCVEAVALLLERGANINVTDGD